MKTLLGFILLGIGAMQGYDLLAMRAACEAAAARRSELAVFRKMLAAAPDEPVVFCYRGAAEMMEAKYALNPINKLSAFSKGKQLIESGIAADSDNIECRFIRYGIQRNLPAMLNYRDQLKNDSLLIARRLDTLKDQDLKKRIANFMKRG